MALAAAVCQSAAELHKLHDERVRELAHAARMQNPGKQLEKASEVPAGRVCEKPKRTRRPKIHNKPTDGFTLLEREEQALQRHKDLSGVSLSRLLQLYTESSSHETRLDLRVLAAKFFIAEVTVKNRGSKVLEFQKDVWRLSASMALDPKENINLNAAFTKAAKERVRNCTGDS